MSADGAAPAAAMMGHRFRVRLVATCVALLAAAAASGANDSPPLILEHLTTSDGLPQGTVYRTLQDSQGFVWLGTEDGLVRYDGHELHRYAYSRSSRTSLPGNFVYDLAEDAHHDLWIAVKDAGLARWNRATDSFTVFRHDAKDGGSLASDAVTAVAIEPAGNVWIGTRDAGVDVLEPASGRIWHVRHTDQDPNSLMDDTVYSIAADRGGRMWIGTASGLDRSDPSRHGFAHYPRGTGGLHSLSGREVVHVAEDHRGGIWVGTSDGGLAQLDRDGRVVRTYRHDAHQPGSLASDDVRAVLEDQAGHLWVGTEEGLDLLDRATGRFTHYRHDESDADSLRDSYIMSLHQDSAGLLWIGTRAGGVSRWNPHSWELGGHRPAWLGTKLVTAFADAPEGRLWVASLGGGLVKYDPETGETTEFNGRGRGNPIGDRNVMSLHQDRRGNLWIGTMSSGLRELRANGRVEAFPAGPGQTHALSAAGVMTVFEGRDGRIWVGTHGGGANIVDPATGAVRQLPHGPAAGAVSAPNVSAFAEDSHGYIWIGTDGGGLDLARADGTVLRTFRHDVTDGQSLPSNTIWSLAVDASDRVWVGTDGGGLALVQGSGEAPEGIRFRVVAREQGLTNDTIYGVLPDMEGRLWLSSNAGLMRFDPRTNAVKTYHREHGLQGEEFDSGAFLRLRDGRLAFGGPGGFNLFNPAHLTDGHRPPRVSLARLEVLGAPIASATPYWLMNRIELDHGASIVSLDFSALDFVSPKRNRLAYRLTDLSDRWIDLGTQQRITLTNLDAGDHLLEVRAANADSEWSDVPLRLTLHRDPAPWRSPWAYAAYALALLAILGYRMHQHRARFRRVVAERERLEAEVALRTRELVETNHELAEAARAKSNFLDRMSHELRTPMNGVVGMTELLGRTSLSPVQSRLTQTIRSSAEILLRIVNDLLDLSKIQAGKVTLESLPLDLVQLLEECTTLFAGAADAKRLELVVCPPPPQPVQLLGDPLRIRQVLMNLVGNAVKFTAQGEVVVSADVRMVTPGRAVLRLVVRDSGVGMDAATVVRIFEPFTQADESTSRRFGGSGLGLTICRELTGLLGGSITVDSTPGVGSTFAVELPLATAAPVALPVALARSVRILTRRPALAESLSRYATLLGLSIGTHSGDLVLVDAGSHAAQLHALLAGEAGSRPALVVIATADEVESLRLEARVGTRNIVLKPVHLAALREAIEAAVGTDAAADGSPIPSPTVALGGHVLLVEDDPVNAAVAQGYLAALGCASVWAADGAEAVARSAAERFDLVLMDLSMPGMDGFTTTGLIRQREAGGRRVPIVALTAHEADSYLDSCLQAGMDDLLTKPYKLEQCRALLERWLGRDARSGPSPGRSETEPLASVDMNAVAGLKRLRRGKKADLYTKLVELFRHGAIEAMREMRDALEASDLKKVAAVCHRLTSSAANVGAIAFSKDVRALGKLAREGDAMTARRRFEVLEAALPALIEELLRLRLAESA